MPVDFSLIQNKQRIYIGGSHGVNEIFELVQHVVNKIQKPMDFYDIQLPYTPTKAATVLIKNGDALVNDQAAFHQLHAHMLVLHRLKGKAPQGYASFEQYISEYEKLADNLPKAGGLIFSADNNMTMLIGKKEREDVKNIEYTALNSVSSSQGLTFHMGKGSVSINTNNEKLPKHLAAAKALLNRIGVTDVQIVSALKTL